jgi:hypothetical protein
VVVGPIALVATSYWRGQPETSTGGAGYVGDGYGGFGDGGPGSGAIASGRGNRQP